MIEDPLDMKAKVEHILSATNNMENRAAKMDVDDLLKYGCGLAHEASAADI
jgi:18S rRNA (adenine1779-N6/adenine1780-N6)-dimethyltransferase